ncbi:MAG TPA: glycosyltransferase [Flexivirga sp.]|uniref:glycosyltransferase n=1 Tax=Flexivirga sp. TaxID=1962927 RepID=UPI002BC78E26|nr:glycosyltransferase [Flexivirga sp.]HWC23432.1 glycosyltransferase [Flexivirga sp.]
MPKRVTWLTLATKVPMGQQTYEVAIQEAVRAIAGPQWAFDANTVGSWRTDATTRIPAKLLKLPATAAAVGRWAGRGADLVHRFDLRIPGPGRAHVVTAHDLPPMRFPDEGSMPSWAQRPLGDVKVICPSEFAASELADLLGARDITVVPYGVRASFQHPEAQTPDELRTLGIRQPFFVHAAGATQRKNLTGLAEAWRSAVGALPDHQLVLLGPPHPRRDELFAGLPNTVLPGRIPLDSVGRVMAAAEAVVVPSIYEGFGLPALEGMAVGTPVIAVDRGALPEVCLDAALMVEPDGAGIAAAILAVGRHEVDRDALIDAGLRRAATFSWEKAAREHLRVYESVVND